MREKETHFNTFTFFSFFFLFSPGFVVFIRFFLCAFFLLTPVMVYSAPRGLEISPGVFLGKNTSRSRLSRSKEISSKWRQQFEGKGSLNREWNGPKRRSTVVYIAPSKFRILRWWINNQLCLAGTVNIAWRNSCLFPRVIRASSIARIISAHTRTSDNKTKNF